MEESGVVNKIQLLQLIRAYGAISVFISHFFGDYEYECIRMGGQLGVAVFFIISGYLLVLKTQYKNLKFYFLKRIIRLVPLYWSLVIVVAVIGKIRPELLHTTVVSFSGLIKSLFFIPDRVGKTEFIQPILPVGWTLYLEVYIYILYYVFLKKLKDNKKAGIGMAIFILGIHVLNEVSYTDNVFLNMYGNKVVLYFIVGIFAAVFLPIRNIFDKYKINFVLSFLGMILFLLCEQFYGSVSYIKIIIVAGGFYILLIFLGNVNVSKVYARIGDLSYSFYLLHYFVLKLIYRICNVVGRSILSSLLILIIAFLITYICSYVSWNLIEVKLGNYFRNKLEKAN